MPKEEDLAGELLNIYNQVDVFLRSQPGSDRNADHTYLIQQVTRSNRIVAKYEPELRAMAQLRNIIVHNPLSGYASPIAGPHPRAVSRYREIHQAILKPLVALSIAIPASKIYTATLSTSLNKVLKNMNENIYTHVPIMDNGEMVGLFSENTLLSYLADKGEAIILNDMTIADFKNYLPLKSHKSECFEFLPRKSKLSDVYDIFNQAIKAHKRVGMIFITESGKPTEKLLGIITAWDLASPEFEMR